jgi:hypothetical protein
LKRKTRKRTPSPLKMMLGRRLKKAKKLREVEMMERNTTPPVNRTKKTEKKNGMRRRSMSRRRHRRRRNGAAAGRPRIPQQVGNALSLEVGVQ